MAIRYYDDAVMDKIQRWIHVDGLRILRPEETRDLFKMKADLNNDKPLTLPMIALSRDTNIELLQATARPLSYDGKVLKRSANTSAQLNGIPISVNYQLDIYTKREEEGDDFMREFVFNLINYPRIKILIPYNGSEVKHVANIRVMSTVSDNSDISERLYKDEFTRWTIQFEIQDAYLFSVPYNENWKIVNVDLDLLGSDNAEKEEEPIVYDTDYIV